MEEVNGTNASIIAMQKEWDEISCPICLDHPHNAVLLICRSHEKGCRSYICDTSSRHSNCLDRFKNLRVNHGNNSDISTEQHHPSRTDQTIASDFFFTNPVTRRSSTENQIDQGHVEENNNGVVSSISESMEGSGRSQRDKNFQLSNILNCPLCRGSVSGWMIVKETRQYLDLKPRSCSRELCSFSGNYKELRQHARRVHPATRPAGVDPSRQRVWRRLEDRWEYNDILSAIRPAIPGAIVVGDYVIDSSNDLPHDHDFGDGGGSWLNTLFLGRMVNSSSSWLLDEPSGSSRPWRTDWRSYGHRTLRRGDYDDDLNVNDDIMMPRRRRRCRRCTRSRHNEEQQ